MNTVNHPSLRVDTWHRIRGGAVERHSIIKGRAADSASLSLLREPINIQGRGAEVVHIREQRNVHVRGDHPDVVDDLGDGDDGLIRQRDERLIDDAAADKRAFEPVKCNQTSRHDIVRAGTYQRVRAVH
jgi:hypothetical protein